MSTRTIISEGLDWLRFKLNTFPKPDYQPIPWFAIETARRCDGVESRWKRIERLTDQLGVKTVIDIGCNNGYFPISFAMKGVTAIGVEPDPKYYETMSYVVRRLKLKNVGILLWEIGPKQAELLPTADCVIFLAVWHHIVKHQGIGVASRIIHTLWNKTQKVLFFETGELEMPKSYNLPEMKPSPEKFIDGYLREHCRGATITHLGLHKAFSPNGKGVMRHLFAAIRT